MISDEEFIRKSVKKAVKKEKKKDDETGRWAENDKKRKTKREK